MSEINTENSIEEQGIPEISLRVSPAETVQAPVDATLSISGEAADAAAVGAALASLQTTLETAIAALSRLVQSIVQRLLLPRRSMAHGLKSKCPSLMGI